MKLQIKVIPSSSKDCLAGWLGDSLRIKVKAPAEKGKANKAVIKLIEESLALKKASVKIVSGLTSCKKTVEITNINDDIIRQQLKNFSA